MTQVAATAPKSKTRSLPRPIRRALGRIDRRLRGIAALRGLGALALVASIGAAVGMAVDFAWSLPPLARWGVWICWVVAVLGMLLAGLWRVLGRRSRAIELAAVIERGDPAFRERLTGAVGLLGANAHGSPALIAALTEDASEYVATIDLKRAAPSGAGWKRLGLGAATLALIAVPAWIWDDPCGQLARRFFQPWVDMDRVGRFIISVEPGDTVLAMGDDLNVSARIVPRFGGTAPASVSHLEWTDATTGRTRRTLMEAAPGEDRAVRAVLPRLPASINYRVVSRSGESRKFRAEAIAPPSVSAISARVEPPAYTKMPATVARDPSRIEAWEDSHVILMMTPSVSVTSAEVTWPSATKSDGQHESMTLSADGKTAHATLTASKAGEYTFNLKESHGLMSRAEPSRRLVLRMDAPPVVATKGAEDVGEARDDDTLRVVVAARDDVAVASVELHYSVERASAAEDSPKDKGTIVAKLDGLNTSNARGEIALSLKPLGVRPGDVVAYLVRVADNRPEPKGPNVVWSNARRLVIAANAAPLWSQQNQADREAIKTTIEALKKAAAENRGQTEQLRYAADAVLRGNGEWDRDRKQALGQREAEARALGEKLEAFAADLDNDPTFRPLARPARQVAKVEAEAARATLDEARQANDPTLRLAELRQADIRLGAVLNRLDELQRQFNDIAGREDDRRHLQDLADRQAQVAEHADAEADADAPQDRAKLDQLEAEQNRVKNDLDALLKKSPALKAEVLEAQANEADAFAKRAREIANRQREEARKSVDMSKNGEALRKLADEQRAIEDDARRLALDADTPLAENGRGRLNTEPLRQAAEPLERGEIDQSRQQLQGAEAELRRFARDLDEIPGDLKALARRLAARQDQLANEILEALGEARGKPALPADEKQGLAKMLAPLTDRQEAIAGLVSAMLDTKEAKADQHPRFPIDAARSAVDALKKAAAAGADPAHPRDVEAMVNNARNTMHRLAGSIPDPWQRGEPTRRAIAEARQAADHAARDAEHHLRETERLLDKEPANAALDLANRLNSLADRARDAAKKLEAIDTPRRLAPQRDRAGNRARKLAESVEALRAAAPRDPKGPGFDPARARALRDALQNAVTENRAALDRLDQKLNGQVPADDVAAELLEEQRQLTKANPDQDKPEIAANQARIATALRNLQAPDAPLELAEAIRLAERAIEGQDAERTKAVKAIAALAERLAARETPRGRVEALARAERALTELDPAEISRRQRNVSAELARLPRADGSQAEAVRRAEDAVQNANALATRAQKPEELVPGRGKPDPAAGRQANEQAAKALDDLAATLDGKAPEAAKNDPKPDTPRDPELMLDPALAAKAQELARRERRVRESLQTLLGERVAPQQDVRREAAELGRELADLRDRAREMSPRAAGPAHEAASLLGEQAPHAMDEAANHLSQGNPTPARDTQRRAAELAERGAQNAEDLAAALRADRGAMKPESEAKHQAAPNPLAGAREAMAQATRQLGKAREQGQNPDALDGAKGAMRSAAEKLQTAAQSQNQGPNAKSLAKNPGQPASDAPAKDPEGGRAGTAKPETLRALQEIVRSKTGRSWGELPGHLRTEILQMSQGRYRDEYVRLIQLYFQEIAADAKGKP